MPVGIGYNAYGQAAAKNQENQTQMGPLGMMAAQAASNIGTGVIGQIFARSNMEAQQRNQMALMKQSQQYGKEMWDYTNYENQVKHLKGAGLNPALLYGKGGGGGATVGGMPSGGAAMAQAPNFQAVNIMDIKAQMAQIKLLEANAKTQESQANLNNVQASKLGGIDTREGEQRIIESGSRIALNTATIDNLQARTDVEKINKELADWDLYIKGASADDVLDTIHNTLENGKETLKRNLWQNKLNDAQYNDLVKELHNKVLKQGIDYLISSKEYSQMDDRWALEQRQVLTGLQQRWQEMNLNHQDRKDRETMERDIHQSNLDESFKDDVMNLLTLGFSARPKTIRNVSIGPKGRTTSHTTTR